MTANGLTRQGAGSGACRLLPRAGRPAVSAASPDAPLRRCPDAGPSPHSRRRADHVAAAAAALGVGGSSVVGDVDVPFLLNAEVHARFLLALPLLMLAELGVHLRMRRLVAQFYRARPGCRAGPAPRQRGHRIGHASAEFVGRRAPAHRAHLRARHPGCGTTSRSTRAPGPRDRRREAASDSPICRSPAGGTRWSACPSSSSCSLRWYFRMFIWTRFLWQVSRIELKLVPTHPDRVGGLGFLGNIVYAFTPLLLAHGVLLAGLIADRIFFAGAKLPQFTVEIIGGRRRTRVPGARPAHGVCGTARTRQAHRASANTACSRSATSESSTRSGCAAAATRPNRSWAAPTSSRLPIWRTVSR